MRVLHYGLGLPPGRSGGMTRYSIDLMVFQASRGRGVFYLYPNSGIVSVSNKMSIKMESCYQGVDVFSLRNSLPIPLLLGVKEPDKFINNRFLNYKNLESFFHKANLDIFHIHTFMGLSFPFLELVKRMKIKIVYTTHDYFGLCPKVNFIDSSGNVCREGRGEKCAICNYNSPASLFLKIRNNKNILNYKRLLRKLRKKSSVRGRGVNKIYVDLATTNKYDLFLNYYKRMLSLVDLFHFNSQVACDLYCSNVDVKKSVVLPISHSGIVDRRKRRQFGHDKIKISLGFIGNANPYKGFQLLLRVLRKIREDGYDNFVLNVWGNEFLNIPDDFVRCMGYYSSSDLNDVFDSIDLLIFPSVCWETFGFVALEALSHGVPVLASSHVGARDVIRGFDSGFVVKPIFDDLYKKLVDIMGDVSILDNYNHLLLDREFEFSFESHVERVESEIYRSI